MHVCMVENLLPQFCFLAAGTVKKTVINDENIFSFIISQIFDIVIYDICREKGSKEESICFSGIKKPIKSIL